MSFCTLPPKISGKEAIGSLLSEHPKFLYKWLGRLPPCSSPCIRRNGGTGTLSTQDCPSQSQNGVKYRETKSWALRRCPSSRCQEGLARWVLGFNWGTKNHCSDQDGKVIPWNNWVYLPEISIFINGMITTSLMITSILTAATVLGL